VTVVDCWLQLIFGRLTTRPSLFMCLEIKSIADLPNALIPCIQCFAEKPSNIRVVQIGVTVCQSRAWAGP
jgi:hypothetical protein